MSQALEIIGEDKLLRAFGELAERLSEPLDAPAHAVIRFEHQRRHLMSEGASTGRPHPRLTPAYERRKRAVYGDRPILQASGVLFESLTREGALFNVHEESGTEFVSGTTHPAATIHQRGRGRNPVRIVLAVSEAETAEHFASFARRQRETAQAVGFEVR